MTERKSNVVRLARRRNNTDVGNAGRLVDTFHDRVRYVADWETWLVWDDRRWQRDTKGMVVELAKQLVADMLRTAAELTGDDRAAMIKWALQSEAAPRIDAMVRLARSDPRVAVGVDDLDADPWLLNVGNGTVDLRTGRLHDHDRANLITKLAPVDYQPEADAPIWAEFLERVLPDEEVRRFVQQVAGYALTGVTTEQILTFAYGTGANGKTTLFETLMAMLGDYAKAAEPDLLMARQEAHPTGVADLRGARLVVSSELDEGRRLAEATVKKLTGGDRIKARFMRQDFFEFDPTHKLVLHANHRPIIRGTDHAIWRRLRLVPFAVTIPPEERDATLGARLRDELPGVLAWAIDGCADWQGNGLVSPQAVTAATGDYRVEMDLLGAFINDECIVTDMAYVGASQLYQSYTRWCDDNGERAVTQMKFGVTLTERGFDRKKHGPERRYHWFGLGLLTTDQGEPLNPSDPLSRMTGHAHARSGDTGEGVQGGSGVHERLPYKDN